jgi:outer membrane biosynthesis protein TonB
MTENWTKEWERRVVNGVYPLRRYLGRSRRSVVFLTECTAQNLSQAAIKILPAIPALAETQLEHWRMAASLSHPHLIRLLDAGRCQLGGHDFLFVVMDLAEQNLAQILPSRPLTPDEVRDLMPPTLDALAYLHGKNLVQGGLKPPNFLVVDDQLKLASDTIRPAGARTAGIAKVSVYDPPEEKKGRMSTAGDMWGLGITLAEALTQTPPTWSRDSADGVSLPENLPPEFLDTVRRCLNRDPDQRPTVAELLAPAQPATPSPPHAIATPSAPEATAPPPTPEAPPTPPSPEPTATPPPAAPPIIDEPAAPAPPEQKSHNRHNRRALAISIAVGIAALWAVWTGMRLLPTHDGAKQTVAITPESPPAESPPAAAVNPKASMGASPPTVLHQEIPNISRHARTSIRDPFKIAVRVTVDRAGNVVAATLDNRGASKYFTRAAMGAAKKWKFAEGQDRSSRVWLLAFDFTREGITADATEERQTSQ